MPVFDNFRVASVKSNYMPIDPYLSKFAIVFYLHPRPGNDADTAKKDRKVR
jgi:hypothetical protein